MGSRLELQTLLASIPLVEEVYFQPTIAQTLVYPCIKYSLEDVDTRHADDKPYSVKRQYSVTVIDTNPDSVIPEYFLKSALCKFDRSYTADNLHHTVFKLFF